MTQQHYLAIDLGAESGRGILAGFDGERIALREIGRFPTTMGQADFGPDGVRRWDFERIWREIEGIVARAKAEAGGTLAGVGADSWGVDFGLLDAEGRLLEPPVHYRDDAHAVAQSHVESLLPRELIWDETGIQALPFNTLYQLKAIQTRDPGLLGRAHRLLQIPDLIHHRLTGGRTMRSERTQASTTQLLDPHARAWHRDLLDRLGLPSHFLGELIDGGSQYGVMPDGTPVYAPGSHDTASAVAAIAPDPETRWAFLSSGTWSLLGAVLNEPILDRAALRQGFSNEGGVGRTIRFLKNIMGLWLVQECRRSLERAEGRAYSYAELAALAEAAPEGGPLIDAVDTRFLAPADMPTEIRAACAETGQTPPEGVGPLIRCCLESLALAYRHGLRDLSALRGAPVEVLHVVGGGTQNRLLNRWAADACGVPVVLGSAEATALGNVLAQLVASGAVADWDQAHAVARRSVAQETIPPDLEAHARWAERKPG